MDSSRGLRRLVVTIMMMLVGLSLSACESRGELNILRDDTYTVEMTVSAPKSDQDNLNCEALKKVFAEAGGENAGRIDDLSTKTEARCHVVISEPQPISSAKPPFPTIVRKSGKYTVTLKPGLLKRAVVSPGTKIVWELTFPGNVLDVSKSNGGKIMPDGKTVRWTDPRILYQGFQVEGAAAVYKVNTAAHAIRDFVIGVGLVLVLFVLLRTREASRLERKVVLGLAHFWVYLKRRWVKFLKSLSPRARRRLIGFGHFWRGIIAWIRRPFRRRARRKRRLQREEWLRKQADSPWAEEDLVLTGQIPIYRVKREEPEESAPLQAKPEAEPEVSVSEPSPEPMPEPSPEPMPEASPEPMAEPLAEPVPAPLPKPISQPQEIPAVAPVTAAADTEYAGSLPLPVLQQAPELTKPISTPDENDQTPVTEREENDSEPRDKGQASAENKPESETSTGSKTTAESAKERILESYNEMLDTGSTIPVPDWSKLSQRWSK